MAKFVCENCNYRFESDSERVLKKCHYCGKLGIVEQPSAQDLINEE